MNSQNLNDQNQNPQNFFREELYKFHDWNRTYGIKKYKLLGICLLIFVFIFFLFFTVSFSGKDTIELNAKHKAEVNKLEQANQELEPIRKLTYCFNYKVSV